MRVISGLFNSHDQAHQAVSALKDAGIASDDISVVSPDGKDGASNTSEGIGAGAAIGGGAGLLAGLGAFAIPGIGPVVGLGWLAATLIGAAAGGAAGGLIGALTESGVDENDAHLYAEHIKRGGTLVTARVDETSEDAAMAILNRAGAADVADLRGTYEATGWTGVGGMRTDDDTVDGYRERTVDDPIVAPFPR